MYSDEDGTFAILAFLLVGLVVSAAASIAGDYDYDNKLFDNNEDSELYLQNMIRGLAIGGMTGLLGSSGFVISYSAFVLKDLIGSQNDGKRVTYDDDKQITNSYKVLGLKAKMEYIRSNDISSKAKMNEYLLLAEWELHNISYYLDIFGILRKH